MAISLIGSMSLNISFVLYLILYVPQIIHNRTETNIAALSFSLHLLLYASYFFDLCYGFANHLPWQYKTVSIVGLLLVGIQHLQFIQFFIRSQRPLLARCSIGFLLFTGMAIIYFFKVIHGILSYETTLLFGAIARIAGLIYCLPQIIKNKTIQSAHALSVKFLILNLSLALLDSISSWCLDWGWPNKVAAPINILLMTIMLGQVKKYNDQNDINTLRAGILSEAETKGPKACT